MAIKRKDPKYEVRWVRDNFKESFSTTDREAADKIAEILRRSDQNSEVLVYVDRDEL